MRRSGFLKSAHYLSSSMRIQLLTESIQQARRAFAFGDQTTFTKALEQAQKAAGEHPSLCEILDSAQAAYPSMNALRLLGEASIHINQSLQERPR